jgi:hypothetical protein
LDSIIDHKRGLAAAGRKAADAAERLYKHENPDASSLKTLQKIAVYKPRPKGFAGHAARAVRLFLGDKSYLEKSNAEMAAILSADFPGFVAPSNLLTERLSAIDKRKIRPLLVERGIRLKLDQANSVSKIKKALIGINEAEAAAATFTGKVAFTDDAVVIGTRRHPIVSGKYPRIHVGGAMLNVEGLKALLGVESL